MFIQSKFEVSNPDVLHALIRSCPLATFITTFDDEIVVNHFPMVLRADGGNGVLVGHVPRANNIWERFGSGAAAVAVFQGPDAYVSPSWYPSKQAHGKVVPTWNYAVVHAHGYPAAVHERDWLLAHLNELTDQQEASQQSPWKVADAPADFIDTLIDSIVGVEMPISNIVGKWKVSQNRSAADVEGVAAGLRRRGGDNALAMKHLVDEAARARS